MASSPGSPEFSRRLNILRQQGRSPEEIGRLVGFSPETITNWMGNQGNNVSSRSFRQMNIIQPGTGFGVLQETPTARVPSNAFFQEGGIPHIPFTSPPPMPAGFTSGMGAWGGSGMGSNVELSGVMDSIKQFGEQMQKQVDLLKQLNDSSTKFRQTLDNVGSDAAFNRIGSAPSAPSGIRSLGGGSSPAMDASSWMGGDLGPPMPPLPPGVPDADMGGYWGRRPRTIAAPALAFGRSTALQEGSLLGQLYPEAQETGDASRGIGDRIGAAFSNVQLDPQKLSGALWRSSLLSTFLIAPQMRAMGDYQESYMNQQQVALQTGQVGYGDLMGGQYGAMQRGQAMRGQAYYGFGEQVYNAYGGAFNSMTGPSGNALGAAFGVLGPAAGVGMIGAAFGGAFGVPGLGQVLGAGALALGTAGYINSAAQNWGAIGAYQNSFAQNRPGTNFETAMLGMQNPEGFIGMGYRGLQYGLGGMSDADLRQFQNAGLYESVAGAVSQGGVSRSQLDTLLAPEGSLNKTLQGRLSGINPASVVSRANELYYNAAPERGITREMAEQNLGFFQRYSTNLIPTAQQDTQLSGLLSSVNDPNGLMSSLASARGINPYNRAGMSGLMSEVLGAGYNDITASAAQYSAGMVAPVNTARIAAGMSRLPSNYYSATADPDANLAQQQIDFGNTGLRRADPRMYDALLNWQGQIGAAGATGDYPRAGQLQGNMATAMGMGQRYLSYGNSYGAVTGLMNSISGLGYEQQNQMFSAMSGDAYAIGALGRATGNADMQMVDPGWQRQYQFNFQQLQRNQSYAMTTGSAPGTAQLGANGQVMGGDNLQYLSGVFQSAGMNFQAGNGMGSWQVADAMTNINRQQQMYNLSQQGRYQDIQQSQFDLAGKQFYERWDWSNRYFENTTQYNRGSMNRARNREVAQFQWQGEDIEYNRNQFDISFGWQQEDFDRNIRFSRGRERLDMIRQRDRSVIQHSMEAGQLDRQEDRFRQTRDWATEEFTLKKQHFEEGVKFQRENLDMQKRHFEESRQFQKQSLEMQQEAHAKQMTWATELFALQDQGRLLERQHYALQFQQQTEYATTLNGIQQTIDSIRSGVELLSEAAVNFRQNVEAIGSGTTTSSGASGSILPPEVLGYLKQIAENPAVVNATIHTNGNTPQINSRDIVNASYKKTRNSR